MNIYVLNKSSAILDQEIQSWIPAFNKFISHVRTYWPRPATAVWCDRTKEPANAWKLVFADTSDVADILGLHNYTPGGKPISYVFVVDDMKYGYNPTVTATHEICEMIADPWISQAFQVNNTQFYAQEIGDPVEADELGFTISVPGFPDVVCSDFVLPNWFIPGAPPKYDFLDHCTQPLQLKPGGYMSIFQSGSGWHQIYAQTVSGVVAKANMGDGIMKQDGYGRLERYGRDRGPAKIKL